MKNQTIKIFVIISILTLAIIASVVTLICYLRRYIPVYSVNVCEITVKDKNTSKETLLNKSYGEEDVTVYFGDDVTDDEPMDFIIKNSVSAYSLLKNNDLIKDEFSVIVSDNFVSDYTIDESLGLCVTLPTKTSREEITSWFLASQNTESDLPFGVYAGITATISESPLFEDILISSIENDVYFADLQFPLYETDNLTDKERKIAYGFAKRIIKDLKSDNKTYADIFSMSKEELDLFLSENYGMRLPEYSFEPYSKEYEYRVKQGCFTYYINKEYKDLVLPDDVFSTKYGALTDWLKDNAETTAKSNEVFRISNMYDINVYLDDGLKSTGITGYAYRTDIDIYSVGSFSHEYIHHILFYLGKSGYAREIIPQMHANASKYDRAMWYYLFTGQANNFPYNKEVKEKETYDKTIDLYKRYSAETPSATNFNYWLFADCFSAIYTEKGKTFIHRAQTDSLAYYIAKEYGGNYVWQINMNTQILIDGKPYSEVVDEWYNYVKSFNK